MKIKELFRSTGVSSQSIGETVNLLDKGNCQVINKTKNSDSISLFLKRASDGKEGQAHLRVQNNFKSIASQLLNHVFTNESIIGLTLDELDNLETNLSIENLQGRLTLKK